MSYCLWRASYNLSSNGRYFCCLSRHKCCTKGKYISSEDNCWKNAPVFSVSHSFPDISFFSSSWSIPITYLILFLYYPSWSLPPCLSRLSCYIAFLFVNPCSTRQAPLLCIRTSWRKARKRHICVHFKGSQYRLPPTSFSPYLCTDWQAEGNRTFHLYWKALKGGWALDLLQCINISRLSHNLKLVSIKHFLYEICS